MRELGNDSEQCGEDKEDGGIIVHAVSPCHEGRQRARDPVHYVPHILAPFMLYYKHNIALRAMLMLNAIQQMQEGGLRVAPHSVKNTQ